MFRGVKTVTTEVQGGVVALGYQRVATNALWKLLSEHITSTLSALMFATNPRHLRRLINNALPDYVSVKAVATGIVIGTAVERHQTGEELVVEVNQAAIQSLDEGVAQFLSEKDRHILLAVLREQAQLSSLVRKVPQENQGHLYHALIEGYWTRLKLDMVTSAALLVATGDLAPGRPEIPHWLCLAARQFLDEWESILFENNPVLHERLSKPLEDLALIPLEEWERELGI
jgi:hypothetical protein